MKISPITPSKYAMDPSVSYKTTVINLGFPKPNVSNRNRGIKFMLASKSLNAWTTLLPVWIGRVNFPESLNFLGIFVSLQCYTLQ